MTRISSLFVATTLAILPLSAFAQTTVTAPVKTTAATGITAPSLTTPAPATVAPGKATAAMPDAKAPVQTKKSEMHSLNNHHEKTSVPTKAAEPAKS